MIAFIAWTPLHVINILNTKLTYYADVEADLYIYDEFNGAQTVYQNMLKEKVFKNVYLVDHKKIGNKLISKINVLLNINRMIKLNKKLDYDIIFTQGGNYFLKILYGQTKKNNPHVKLNYIEDGLATYLNLRLLNISDVRRKIMNILNPYSMFLAEITDYYLYEPNLTTIDQCFQLNQLSVIEKEGILYEKLKRIFGLPAETKKIENALLFLDQPLEKDGYKVHEKTILTTVKQYSLNKKFLVKLHPRTSPESYGKDSEIFETSLPLELCFLAYDLQDTVIVSCVSTASFTPRMMFGLTNEVILLSEMVRNDREFSTEDERTQHVLKGVSDFYERYHSIGYHNVRMPINKEELKLVLEGE
ncbi:polysialyltransferase family glycosyltransferase [Carnobacterium sp. TMP28]|uniref:polysialyltransferase family glycosyltransferase n=1 Tax=Carnobacterium sp. TMP28 TaxID=3397060 RepID=UPI0039E04A10